MKKHTIIVLLGVVALFALQAFWLQRTYTLYIEEKQSVTDESFKIAIDKELSHRQFTYKDPKNPRFIYKAADAMTPAERERLKGDTLNLGDLADKGIAMSFTEALMQMTQDQLATREPLKLPVLDSLYRKELRERRLDISSCKIWYMDKDTVATDSIGQATRFPWGAITTELRPIGLYATHFLRAEVTVAPTAVMMDLLYTLIASVGIALFILATLYYQWVVIGHTRQALAAREAAVHHAIHDLKSPLNGIYVLLDSLRDTVRNDAEMAHFLRNGMGRIKRMTEMINSMLDATRKPAGSTSPVREELDIEELLMPLEEELRESFPGAVSKLAQPLL